MCVILTVVTELHCLDHGFTTLTSPVCGKARRCCCCVRVCAARRPRNHCHGGRVRGAGRGGMASNGPQVRWRPDNTVTQHQHTQHTPSLHPGGPHPPSSHLITRIQRGIFCSTCQNPHNTSYMTHSGRKSWNRKRISNVCPMSH